jgi:putative ABC transport system permease protein
MEKFFQDLRYGFRLLARKPSFTLVAIVALALGIGANSVIFSVVNAVLLRPLPYEEPEQLMMAWENNTKQGESKSSVSYLNYIDWKNQSKTFSSLAAYSYWPFVLVGTGEPERIWGAAVSPEFFPTLEIKPIIGRSFFAEEDQKGRDNVVILSHSLWQRRFNSDPNITDKPIILNGNSFNVIGVLPETFKYPLLDEAEFWAPLSLSASYQQSRGLHYLEVVGRLGDGISQAQAQAEMETIASQLEAQYSDTNSGWRINLVPLHEQITGDVRAVMLVLIGAVGFVLLIACTNVANLLMARATARYKEMALRLALGATRGRIIRQLLTESVLLALMGGAAGLLLAYWAIRLLVNLAPAAIPRVKEVTIDERVLIFTLVVSVLTAIIFGLVPGLQASKPNLEQTLKEGGSRGMSFVSRARVRNTFVILEIALTLVLLIGAGLMVKSFIHLQQVDPGFNPDNLLTMHISLPRTRYNDARPQAEFFRQALEKVSSLPGVRTAAAVTTVPMAGRPVTWNFSVEGQAPLLLSEQPTTKWNAISSAYFETMGIPILRGRPFSEQDKREAPPVAIINETMARRFFADQDPIGKRVIVAYDEMIPREIVGVVADVKHTGLEKETGPEIYTPYTQLIWPSMGILVRTASDPMSLANAARGKIWEIDPDQPIENVKSMQQVLYDSVSSNRFNMILFGIFAAVALVLAAVGVYGVIAYTVSQRTHEIGIRVALGASSRDILKLIVGQGVVLSVIGVLLGLVAAFVLTRTMSGLLYDVSPTDPITFVSIALLLLAVAVIASYVPARRATKVDPTIALKYE